MTMLEESLREKTEQKKKMLHFLKRGKTEDTAFRVRCLLKRVEQQLQHTTNIIKKMQQNGVQMSLISLVGKVIREILHLRHQLLRILDNDLLTLMQIGDADDLEEFFQYVEDICSAAEEVKFNEPKKENLLKEESVEKQNLRLFQMLKDGKEMKGTKAQSQTSIIGQAFRVRCLLIRLEQQLQHTTNIIKKMQRNGFQRPRISLMGKVMRDVLQLRYQILRVIDYDPVTLVQIGDADDLEEFFLYVEDICSAAEAVKFSDPNKDNILKEQNLMLLEMLKGKKGKKDKKSNSSIIGQAFRVRCLLIRVEQQLKHTTNIIKKMQQTGVQRARISIIGKVMRDVLQLRYQLLRIIDNDPVTLVQIGDADELEDFFLYVEDICSAAEEIQFNEPQQEQMFKDESAEKKRLRLLESLESGKVNCNECDDMNINTNLAFRGRCLLIRVEHQLQHTTNVIKKMYQNGVKRARISHVRKVMRNVLNLRRQLLRIIDNDPVTLVQIGDAEDLEDFFLYVEDICSPLKEIEFDEPKKVDIFRKESAEKKKLGLLKRPKGGKEVKCKKSQSQLFIEGPESILVEDWLDPETDGEMTMVQGQGPSDRQKYKWPLLYTTPKTRTEKEKQLHSLMTEIEGLMEEVVLTDKKTEQTDLTYKGEFEEGLDKLLAESDAST